MAVILDTATLPVGDRAAAFDATLNTATMPVRTQRTTEDTEVYARLQYWQLGPGVDQIYTETSGFRFSRTARHVRIAGPERISLAMHLKDPYVLTQGNLTSTSGDAELRLLDLTAPYSYATRGNPAAQSVSIDCDRLGLPVDVVRAASPKLAGSPLYELSRTYFRQLPAAAAQVEGTAAATMLGASATELARALIAAEHNISLRYLHKLFESRELTVNQWVMARRLEGARRDLATNHPRNGGVAFVARRWGFTNAAHFARRFRRGYGMSAQDWQRLNRAGSGGAPG
jgi:AraC-like DNA-binding protein